MSKGLIGKKLGMTGHFTPDGRYIPVTVIQAGPCVVTQIKRVATDGYNALQLGFGPKKASRVTRPMKGHLKNSGGQLFGTLREFPVENPDEFSLGQQISLEQFAIGDKVHISGTTKGHGFSGVIKRHGFHRGPETHGSKNVRPPGSIGSSAWPSRVVKGKRLPGHYGDEKMTVRNLEIVDIRPEQNLILVKGAVPGSRSALVIIRKRG